MRGTNAPRRDATVRVVVDGTRHAGRAVDLRGAGVDVTTALAAVVDGAETGGLRVEAPEPGPLHRTLGAVDGRRGADRGVLAAVARSRGHDAPQDRVVDRLQDRLADLDPPSVDRRAVRERLADRRAETERLRERVAQLRGRVQACREGDVDADPPVEALDAATERLLEADTERVAARQRLDRLRSAARDARDSRERRLELQDRIENRRREARRALAERALPAFATALAALPERDPPSAGASHARSNAAAELAAYRCGRPAAPVVVATSPFADADSTARWLDAPVLRV